MLLWLFVAVLSAPFFYLEALKAGMAPRRWLIQGLLLGPLLWPLFQAERQLHRRAVQKNAASWDS
ncbi:conserved hypothetical protein [Ferrimonas balearica DSM 9799]|uniref:Uncharacterized protein n=1 Tax=Ferrimonas balearica (strain DSM 9799 / CCM 4581 / KCTC 23876 / PAT) TaxID=550540 RepID=E1SQ59_FERBD|nr:hypothetical protein [Ferrimonas balearica]MBY6017316.1 hypothetical protein [Halomonas denitrificans]ADN76831.1 conserved hypothetical protein [Ferrimonas balearica DSM 9799]MBW3140184.1 hypothetical protein [Ferrimonas balearica]MBW3165204.1 hypothetical protein [Ferrimonas balearica]MBY5979932.1 hypothetical protein [Ferrimonas balearica]